MSIPEAYARILNKSPYIKHFAYIDGFAGAGIHKSKTSGQLIQGSPAIALGVKPPFSHYHFIDMDGKRAAQLRRLAARRSNVSVYEGDCNKVLLEEVFPKCQYSDFRRALCLLDPYELNPRWEVVERAGMMKSIEIFLNFMIMDANMNVLRHDQGSVDPSQAKRMDTFWGDGSWRQIAYVKQKGLFGDMESKAQNEAIVAGYKKRLREVAGFKYVPEPIPMRNGKGATVYYLFFASNNEAGENIARDVFKKWENAGAPDGR